MTGKQAFDAKIEKLQALKAQGPSPETESALRRALNDRNNYMVAKAAEITGQLEIRALIADLCAAFRRFLEDAVKTDPQCWAKNAIVKALVTFEHADADLYLAGLHHVQMEPVYGGRQDSAAALRGACAHALILCRELSDHTIQRHLVDLMSDHEVDARVEAARAIAQLGRPEGSLLLRLKIHLGDREQQVMGQVMSALLAYEGGENVSLVARFLEQGYDGLGLEAAAALGECRRVEGFAALRGAYERSADSRWSEALLVAMGASLLPEAVDFLIELIGSESSRTSGQALKALEPAMYREEVRTRVEQARRM